MADHPGTHEPVELTESAKRRLPKAIEAREKRQAGSAVRETARRVSTRKERTEASARSSASALNAALGIRRNNQTTDSNN